MIQEIVSVWNQWHVVVVFVGATIAVLASIWVFKEILKKISKGGDTNISLLRKKWQKSLLLLLVLVFLYFVESFLVPKEYSSYYSHLLTLFVITFVTWFVIQALYSVCDMMIRRAEQNSDDVSVRSMRTKLNILLKVAIFVIVLVGVSFALMTFPKIRQLGVSILASAGVMGVIIGFAAQKSIGTLLAGIQIAFTQPIKIDDIVIVEDKWGVIEEITLTYVVVRIWDRSRLVVPITYFIEKVFQNWTRGSFEVIGSVFMKIDHATPIGELRVALDRIVEESGLWDGRVKKIDVTDANAQVIEIRILVSAATSADLWNLRCLVREKLVEFLQKNHPGCLPKSRIAIKDK